MTSVEAIPVPVIRRLTQYLEFVEKRRDDGLKWLSSREIAQALGLTQSTVRQDMTHLPVQGRSGSGQGYEVRQLEKELAQTLGMDRLTNVCVVGAGNMGRALAKHGGFERRRFRIRALFDNNPRLTARKVGQVMTYPMTQLTTVVAAEKIDIGIIAVPESAAQRAADSLIIAGVKGLLNLTLAHVWVPRDVVLVNARLVASLQELFCRLRIKERHGTASQSRSTERRKSK